MKEYKPLNIPLIRDLDLRRPGKPEASTEEIKLKPHETVSYIVYQHKGGKAA